LPATGDEQGRLKVRSVTAVAATSAVSIPPRSG
jgi:hypothetical protein